MLARLPVGRLLSGGAILLVFVAFVLWWLPSPDYLFLPNAAKPLDGRVAVEGGSEPKGPGGIYYLDVTVRRARWLEHLLPFTRPNGASMVPRSAVVPHGSSFGAEHQQELAEMSRSEQVAAAVALRQAGYHVTAEPTGVLVEGVYLDTPAARTLRDGDVIVGVEGRKVLRVAELHRSLTRVRPGTVVSLRLTRNGKARTLSVRTIADPADRTRALIGIRVAQDATIRLPVSVKIDLGGVGGPSAGLPFALDVMEQLGKNVDRGYKVAATGELDLDGSVEPIGGVKQKTIGARRAGVDVLLVPAGENAATAKRYAGSLRLVAVESFQQALRVLATLPLKR